jgi:Carboxypeptidase regulatory-like domain
VSRRRPGYGWTDVLLVLLLVVMVVLAATACGAQSSVPAASASATITGTVMSKSGEAYQGVRVSLAMAGAAPARTAQTDANGEFQFTNLPAGAFTVTVTSEGFVTQTVSGELHAGQSFDAKTIVLPLQESTSEVRVSASQQALLAEQQIHAEEQQRVLGVLPNYYVSYDKNPVPLTPRQKFGLAFRSNFSPYTFLLTGVTAGVEQATNAYTGYGGGFEGYGKRYGAAYADTVISNEIGGAILPTLFRQDPRYFYMGTGSVGARLKHAAASAVICRGDNMRPQFSYSSIVGGLAAAGIANLYYPEGSRSDATLLFENMGIGLAGSALENIAQEFVVRKFTPSARKSRSH